MEQPHRVQIMTTKKQLYLEFCHVAVYLVIYVLVLYVVLYNENFCQMVKPDPYFNAMRYFYCTLHMFHYSNTKKIHIFD